MRKHVSVVLSALLIAVVTAASAKATPPTLDPTYGLPMPSRTATPPATVAAGNWIWVTPARDNQTAYMRRIFLLKAVPATAVLHITGDDYFTLFVNDQQIDSSAPGQPGASGWSFVHTLDIAPYLTNGVNVIAVSAVNDGGAAGLLARLEMPGETPIITDSTWKAFVADTPPRNWSQVSFDDSGWPAATIEAAVGQGPWETVAVLQGWPGLDATAPYLAHRILPVAAILNIHNGAGKISGARTLPGHIDAELTVTLPPSSGADTPGLVVDFGKEVAGRLVLTGSTPGLVLVGTGESCEEATHSPWQGPNSMHLIAGSPVYTPYTAFRYANLTFPTSGVTRLLQLRLALDHKYYPVEYKGSFSCSDPAITKLWYTGAYTAHLCMQEDIWDAPKRDRARWVGDLHISGAVINDVFADKFLMEQTLQRLRSDAGSGHVNGIPGYSAAWICTLADFHRHLGDYVYLNQQHDALLSLLKVMRGEMDERNLFADKSGAWTFVDWSPDFGGNTPQAYAATDLFYVKAAHESAFLLREMGDTKNAAQYADWAQTLSVAAGKYFPDPVFQTYGNQLQENAMAVCAGVATPTQEKAIYQRVLSFDSFAWDKTGSPAYNSNVITPYYGNYVLRALSLTGHTDAGLRFLRSYWGGMIDEGATTFWESYDPNWEKAHFHLHLLADNTKGTFVSLCHGWSAAPTAWLTDHVLGVQPTGGGFRTVVIRPELGDLTWAEGSVPTPHGMIHVRADKKSGHFVCHVTLPEGIEADVSVPGKEAVRINHQGSFVIK